ncbi:hypothetical protein [Vibrio sp. VB16]|uniref:hypothetical protein n=1 Tax=Vibrio sp. VB16 TaxID=2785746 RepID=UPI00189D99B9|nr:hypothetical protein [Vibrio sp. VB16]UGA56716.1 hypothetical protein IUZ65_021205 [Vibrio sp. VB16]
MKKIIIVSGLIVLVGCSSPGPLYKAFAPFTTYTVSEQVTKEALFTFTTREKATFYYNKHLDRGKLSLIRYDPGVGYSFIFDITDVSDMPHGNAFNILVNDKFQEKVDEEMQKYHALLDSPPYPNAFADSGFRYTTYYTSELADYFGLKCIKNVEIQKDVVLLATRPDDKFDQYRYDYWCPVMLSGNLAVLSSTTQVSIRRDELANYNGDAIPTDEEILRGFKRELKPIIDSIKFIHQPTQTLPTSFKQINK